MKRQIKKIFMTWSGWMYLLNPMNVFASEANKLENSNFVKGWKELIADGTKVGLGVTAGLVAIIEIVLGIQYVTGEDESKPALKKNMKTILLVGAFLVSVEGIVTVIFSYFI